MYIITVKKEAMNLNENGKGYMGAVFGGRKGKAKFQLYYYPKNTNKNQKRKNTAIIFKERIKK